MVRIIKDHEELKDLATIFGAPFVLHSKNINKSFRNSCFQLNKPIVLFEGGKSFYVDNTISNQQEVDISKFSKEIYTINVIDQQSSYVRKLFVE